MRPYARVHLRSEGSREDDGDSAHWPPLLSRVAAAGASPPPSVPTTMGSRCAALSAAVPAGGGHRPTTAVSAPASGTGQASASAHPQGLGLLSQPALRTDQPHHRGSILGP